MTMIFPALDRLAEIDRLARLVVRLRALRGAGRDRPARRDAGRRHRRASATSCAPRSRPMTATGPTAPRSSGSPRWSIPARCRCRSSHDGRRIGADLPHLAERPRHRAAGDHRRGDPRRGRGRPARAGQGRDGHRAARASRSPTRPSTATSTCCAAMSRRWPRRREDRRRLRRQLSARPALGDGAPQSLRSAHRHAAGDPRRDRHHRDAHRRDDGARRQASGAARTARCSAMSARAARPTGTCACSTGCSASTRSACIRAGRKAATPLPRGSRSDLGKPVRAVATWRECVEGADIVVEASRLDAPEPLLKTEWIKRVAPSSCPTAR